jgi:branched-chain amino acid transport system ATP-binding protein
LQIDLRKLAGMLSGGEQQILAIARGLMAQPQLLMVDEPSLGLAPQMVESVYEMLEAIAAQGTAVLLVEQNVTLALEITQRAYVLQQGRLVLSGESAGLVADSRVVDAYLGTAPVREQTLA